MHGKIALGIFGGIAAACAAIWGIDKYLNSPSPVITGTKKSPSNNSGNNSANNNSDLPPNITHSYGNTLLAYGFPIIGSGKNYPQSPPPSGINTPFWDSDTGQWIEEPAFT